ncbi:MAG: hypothetical protein M3Y09_09835, partial [Actinomycetota bacterium]|nr:hypothetical protein [Actinomycetota bacterium]
PTARSPAEFTPWARPQPGDALPEAQRALLVALAEGQPTEGALARAGLGTEAGLAALAALELTGLIRREAGGSWTVRAS